MNQQPDKFFRDKLHNYQPPVPADAWRRVSQNLNDRKRSGLFLKIAAAILLVATGTLLFYPSIETNNTLVSDAAPVDTQPLNESGEKTDAQIAVPQKQGQEIPPTQNDDKRKKRSEQDTTPLPAGKRAMAKDTSSVPSTLPELPVQKEPLSNNPIAVAVPPDSQPDEHENADTPQEEVKTVTIVFTAEEVNRKYFTKNTDAEATNDDEEPSGLKKLLDKAYDLKYNQDLLGSLRQKKNEILAMNFRTEKETSQND